MIYYWYIYICIYIYMIYYWYIYIYDSLFSHVFFWGSGMSKKWTHFSAIQSDPKTFFAFPKATSIRSVHRNHGLFLARLARKNYSFLQNAVSSYWPGLTLGANLLLLKKSFNPQEHAPCQKKTRPLAAVAETGPKRWIRFGVPNLRGRPHEEGFVRINGGIAQECSKLPFGAKKAGNIGTSFFLPTQICGASDPFAPSLKWFVWHRRKPWRAIITWKGVYNILQMGVSIYGVTPKMIVFF